VEGEWTRDEVTEGRKMSGRPRMGGKLWQIHGAVADVANDILCDYCGPSRGWGWEVPDEYMSKNWCGENPVSLPPAGNGFPIKGLCQFCAGMGIVPIPLSEFY